jgi:hypothetical protein
MSGSRRFSVGGGMAIAVALFTGSCSSGCGDAGAGTASKDGGASGSGSSGGVTDATVGCATDGDCAASVPPTIASPGVGANCATGKCNVLQGVCEYVAKDEDGDGHPAANCESTNGISIREGDDCNDQDPNLYPGHPEACTPPADAGTMTSIPCTGQVSCLASGEESPCVVMTSCTNQACVNGLCAGTCQPGSTQCESNGVSTCSSGGTWGEPEPCDASTCISSAGRASCMGDCAASDTGCSGVQPTVCVNGQWQPSGPACSGNTASCCGGACTSEQDDVANCGACGNACSAATNPACVAGLCQYTLASGQGQPEAIAVNTTAIYWSALGANPPSIMQVPLTGGASSVAVGSVAAFYIGVDSSSLYWTDEQLPGSVWKAPLTGGTPEAIATGRYGPAQVAVDATSVYWMDEGATGANCHPSFQPGYVAKVSLSGGTVTNLAGPFGTTCSSGPVPSAIAVNGTSVYYGLENVGSISRIGTDTPLFSGSNHYISALAADSVNAYWVDSDANAVMSVPVGGGPPMTLATATGIVAALAVDGASVYWADSAGISKVATSGGKATLVASTPLTVRFVVDATNVYWTTGPNTAGKVMSAPR